MILKNRYGHRVSISDKYANDLMQVMQSGDYRSVNMLVSKFADDFVPPEEPKKVVIIAEQPNVPEYTEDVTIDPKHTELLSKSNEYRKRLKAYDDVYLKWSKDAYRNSFINYLKGYTGEDVEDFDMRSYKLKDSSWVEYDDVLLNDERVKEYINDNEFLMSEDKELYKIRGDVDNLYNKAYPEGQPNKTFENESQRAAEYYRKNNIPYEIVPMYGDKSVIEKIAARDDVSDLVILGHSGGKIGGIPLNEWNSVLKNAKYDRCILGSCYGDDLLPELKDVKNIYHTNNIPWEGFNPKAGSSEKFYFPKGHRVSNVK